MNRQRFSAIAHEEHVFLNPIGEETADRFLERIPLAPGDRVLDVGCGSAEMLLRLIERRGVRGVGVDPNPYFLERARAAARARASNGALELHQCAIEEYARPAEGFAATLCVGATYAFGGYRAALGGLAALVRPGGTLLIGEGYWKQEPATEYLATFGGTQNECGTHPGNVEQAIAAGLTPLADSVASEVEWEQYEALYARTAEHWVEEHPDDPEAGEMLAHVRRWRQAFLRWGRHTMGFGLYLFRTPV